LCEGGAGSNRSYGAGKRACRGESAGEHLEGCQWGGRRAVGSNAYVVM
jgi:hypothetical protein